MMMEFEGYVPSHLLADARQENTRLKELIKLMTDKIIGTIECPPKTPGECYGYCPGCFGCPPETPYPNCECSDDCPDCWFDYINGQLKRAEGVHDGRELQD
jgi:hypothetical protein